MKILFSYLRKYKGLARLLLIGFASRRGHGTGPLRLSVTITSPMLTPAQFAARHKMALLGQSSTPQDVASTVRFALENQSITGTTLLVDGGQHLMRFERDFSMMQEPVRK